MPATTTTTLASLIPTDVVVGEMIAVARDRASLISTCAVARGMKTAKFSHLAAFTAAGVVEGAAVVPAAVTPTATSVTGSPREVPPVQMTRFAMETSEGDMSWLQLGGALGLALGDDQNGLITATFATNFDGNYQSATATDGAGNAAALTLAALDLALEQAEGNNTESLAFAGDAVMVLHPAQWSDIRDDLRTSGNFIAKPEVTGINRALDPSGIAGTYYGVPILLSSKVASGAHTAAAGTGAELVTGAAYAAGNTYKGAIFSIGQAVGFCESMAPNVRTEETALIATGGMNVVAGYVGACARFSPFLSGIQSAA